MSKNQIYSLNAVQGYEGANGAIKWAEEVAAGYRQATRSICQCHKSLGVLASATIGGDSALDSVEAANGAIKWAKKHAAERFTLDTDSGTFVVDTDSGNSFVEAQVLFETIAEAIKIMHDNDAAALTIHITNSMHGLDEEDEEDEEAPPP